MQMIKLLQIPSKFVRFAAFSFSARPKKAEPLEEMKQYIANRNELKPSSQAFNFETDIKPVLAQLQTLGLNNH